MLKWALPCVFIVGLSCNTGRRPEPVVLAPTEVRYKVNRAELEAELETHALEIYQQLSLGNVSAYWDGIAAQRDVALLGVLPINVVVGAKPGDRRMDLRLYRNRSPRLLSKNLDSHVSYDESLGWIYDEISYRVQNMKKEAALPIRTTSVFTRDVDRWVTVLEHHSYAFPLKRALELAAEGQLRDPLRFASKNSLSVDDSTPILDLIDRLHLGELGAEDISTKQGHQTLVLWPNPVHEFRGDAILRAPALVDLIGLEASLKIGDTRFEQSKSQNVVWVVANLAASTSISGRRVAYGLRANYIFERGTQDSPWLIMQAHVSVPLDESQLSSEVFGPEPQLPSNSAGKR